MGVSITVPVLVGVTGHRDILPAAETPVRAAVAAVLQTLQRELGDALHVVTALAEGADLLVAEVAAALDISLIAVSPMPLDRYRATLSTAPARADLDRLWNHNRTVLRLELPLTPEGTDEAQYEQLGLLLSRQSHLLLALWNGAAGGSRGMARGGSAHVVAMRRLGERDQVAPASLWGSPLFSGRPPLLELARSGPVLHLVTPRAKPGDAACTDARGVDRQPGDLLWWSDLPGPAAHHRKPGIPGALRHAIWPAYERPEIRPTTTWSAINVENLPRHLPEQLRQVAGLGPALTAHLREANLAALHGKHEGYLCPDADGGDGPALESMPAAAHPALHWLRRLQAALDVSAASHQAKIMGVWSPGLPWRKGVRLWPLGALSWFALAVPFMALFYELHAHVFENGWMLVPYWLCIIGPLLFYVLWVRRGQWQEQFQDLRALAEALRVQFFWAVAGVPVAVSDNYLGQHADALGWIRLALRGPALWGVAAATAAGGPNVAVLTRRWLEDQREYFVGKHDKARQNEQAAVRMDRGVRLMVAALVALPPAALLALLAAWDWPAEGLVFLLGLLPPLVAFFVIITEGRAYEAQAHAYARAGAVFRRAAERAATLQPDDRQGWREIALALGREALAENAAWLEAHRQRPVMSKAG